MNVLFLPKLLPRADIIGGPILIYHRIKNLSLMGHKITLIAPAYTEQDLQDKSLHPFCERIIRIKSVRERPGDEVEALYVKLNRPRFFLNGDGGFSQEIEDVLNLTLKEMHIDAIITDQPRPELAQRYEQLIEDLASSNHEWRHDRMKLKQAIDKLIVTS